MVVHHIGYLVKNITKAQNEFLDLGYSVKQEKIFDPYRKIDIVFLEKDGYLIELVSPADENSIVSGLSKKIKNSPYHICYVSDDFEKDINNLIGMGFFQMDKPMEAPALHNQRVTFLMSPQIGLIEVIEHLRNNS